SGAVTNLLRKRLVAWRRAMDHGGDPGMAQLEAIFAGGRPGLTGEAQFMEHWVHEIAGAVPSEGTPGAVGSMGAGSKAEDEQTGAGIAKAGDRTRPVDLVLVRTATSFADPAAVVAQARA